MRLQIKKTGIGWRVPRIDGRAEEFHAQSAVGFAGLRSNRQPEKAVVLDELVQLELGVASIKSQHIRLIDFLGRCDRIAARTADQVRDYTLSPVRGDSPRHSLINMRVTREHGIGPEICLLTSSIKVVAKRH